MHSWPLHGRIWNGGRAVVTVNYAPHASQCYIRLPFLELAEQTVRFTDQMSNALYDRNGNDLLSGGIYLDLPAWGYHIFELTEPPKTTIEETKIIVAPKHEMIPA